MKLLAVLLFALSTLAHADPVTIVPAVQLDVPPGCTLSTDRAKLSCPTGPGIPQCPSPPGAGPCTPIPQCPSPPGAGPCPGGPVDPGAISCPGFDKTIVLPMDWNNPQRMATADHGTMRFKDAVVAVFKTGGVKSPDNNLPRISAAEFSTTNPSTRIGVLSAKPCDWSAQAMPGATVSSSSVTIAFTVNNPANWDFYPILALNTTYYFNIKNDANAACSFLDICNLAVDLTPVRATPSAATSSTAIAAANAADKAYAKAALAANKARTAVVPASALNAPTAAKSKAAK